MRSVIEEKCFKFVDSDGILSLSVSTSTMNNKPYLLFNGGCYPEELVEIVKILTAATEKKEE